MNISLGYFLSLGNGVRLRGSRPRTDHPAKNIHFNWTRDLIPFGSVGDLYNTKGLCMRIPSADKYCLGITNDALLKQILLGDFYNDFNAFR